MRVLICAASKYGSTAQIGKAIADTLAARGHTTTVLAPDNVTSLDAYEAVVLGSAVYAGRWLKPAREMAEDLSEELATRPVWLFSSGPIGDPPKPIEESPDAVAIVARVNAREHRVFAGNLDKAKLNFAERAMVKAFKVAEGDFRVWVEIETWAAAIAEALEQATSTK